MVGFYDGAEFTIFDKMEDFLDHVLKFTYRGYKIYAHNGGRYDFRFIIDSLSGDTRFKMKHLFTQDRIRELVIQDASKHRWYFADSFALLPSSLKKITHDFDVKHKKLDDVDYSNISKHNPKDRLYLKHDCLGLYEVLEKYFDQEIFDGLRPKGTIASNAMQIFRSSLKRPLKRTTKNMEDFIRQGYFGGRTEVFKLIARNVDHYDYNSLYPSVMLENKMPVGLPIWTDTYIKGKIGFYEASIDYPSSTYIPALPLLRDNKLLFPTGKFSGHFVSCELDRAIEQGARVKVKSGVVFHVGRKIFTDYVNQLYKIKSVSDSKSAQYFIAKIYLNGLYGKFGQNPEKETIVKTSFEEALEKELIPYLPELGLYKEKNISCAGYLLPHIASWITAKARLKLHDALLACKDPYYCDTDSIFATQKFKTCDKTLGALKYEGHYEDAIFLLPKLYALKSGSNEYVKAKGFRQAFLKNIHFLSYKKGLGGDLRDFKCEGEKLLGIKTGWKREGKTLVMGTDKKSIQSHYSKRVVLPDYSTRAHILLEK